MLRRLYEVESLRVAVNDQDAAVRRHPDPPFAADGTRLPFGWVEVIPAISYGVDAGEVLALIGESASGKSLALHGAFALLPSGARVLGGRTHLDGRSFQPGGAVPEPGAKQKRKDRKKIRRAGTVMANYDDEEWSHLVGSEVGFLFQNPVAAWTPEIVIGEQAGEVLEVHTDLDREQITSRVYDALGEVQLPRSSRFFGAFRHEVSRGQAQRAMLAAALVKAPRLLIADEPLTGLDVPVAAAIRDLIRDMQIKRGMAMILVTHDLAAVAGMADRVAVVYAGRVIEEGATSDLFRRPRHPYTDGLLGSIPGLHAGRLRPIRGEAPSLTEIPTGRCTFADRCNYAETACYESEPELEGVEGGRVACHRWRQLDLEGITG